MIKVNLLESVTDRTNTKTVAVVEQKVTNPRVRMALLGFVVMALTVLLMGYDYVSSRNMRDEAQRQLDEQQRIAAQMAAVNKEQAEVEKKTKEIQVRIDAIQKLRAAQQGPSQVLTAIKERFDGAPELYLESVEQKGSDLTIAGGSPNEASVTRFGKSLEFSSGLFNNLSIETQRSVLTPIGQTTAAASATQTPNPNALKPIELVSFKIKCNYQPTATTPPAPANNAATTATTTTTTTTTAAPSANQVARK